jgi:endonuclease V-like protein UPF0215 family
VLGIDDGPFEKHSGERGSAQPREADTHTPIVAVRMEGHDLVEGVAVTRFPVDGDDAAGFLAEWILGLRLHQGLQGIVLGGITVAGLGVVDVEELCERTAVPLVVVNRRDPSGSRLGDALRAAKLEDRLEIVERTPPAYRGASGIFLACAGAPREAAEALVAATTHKADLPEPLRLAHLVAAAIARGSSRGRV